MLRISGQLMLGVTRIYSRKVQYLLDDCKETRERIALVRCPYQSRGGQGGIMKGVRRRNAPHAY